MTLMEAVELYESNDYTSFDEALEIANGFAAEASARDKTRPKNEVFHAAFTARFAPSTQVNAPRHYR